jgi:proteasome accessory factor B
MAVEKISPSDRLLNLTAALLNTPQGLTMVEIYRSVPGYGYLSGVKPNSKESKLLNRDIEDLRDMGIRVQTQGDKNERYLIEPGTFQWPADFKPTASQMRLLEIAAHCWQDIALSEDLESALNLLSAIGETPDRAAVAELIPNFRPIHPEYGSFLAAIEAKRVVSFSYRKPGSSTAEKRVVSPWLFISVEGQWLLQGWDMERNAVRNFMLKRVVSQKLTSEPDVAYRDSEPGERETALRELEEIKENNLAKIRVRPDTAAWSHFELEFEAGDIKEIHFVDDELMAAELRRFGNQLEILEPQHIIDAVRAGLQRVVDAHA